jgi:glycosyltransferase involved in cell wall biosynthesis
MAPRRGKGAAIAAGFAAARGTIIVMIDADGSNDPAEIPLFVAALMAGADFAKGSRFMPGGRSADITLVRRLGNTVLNRAVNGLFGTAYTDLCYGFNAIWARHVATLDVNCDGFEVETLMDNRPRALLHARRPGATEPDCVAVASRSTTMRAKASATRAR